MLYSIPQVRFSLSSRDWTKRGLFNGKVVLLHTFTIQITLSYFNSRKELKTACILDSICGYPWVPISTTSSFWGQNQSRKVTKCRSITAWSNLLDWWAWKPGTQASNRFHAFLWKKLQTYTSADASRRWWCRRASRCRGLPSSWAATATTSISSSPANGLTLARWWSCPSSCSTTSLRNWAGGYGMAASPLQNFPTPHPHSKSEDVEYSPQKNYEDLEYFQV